MPVREREIALPSAWRDEWAASAFAAPRNESDAVAAEWERVRLALLNDNRTMQALEAYTNRQWVARYRREAVATLAAHDWESLKAKPGLGMSKLRNLVEIFAIAAADL